MCQITRALAAEDSAIQRGATYASCRRTVATIRFQAPIPKCVHCSRPLIQGEAGVTIDGDRFHDASLAAREILGRRLRQLSRMGDDLLDRVAR